MKQGIKERYREGAHIYAQDTIRKNNQALAHLCMKSRIKVCVSPVEMAVQMGQVTGSIKGVIGRIKRLLASIDINQILTLMDKFERQFEDLDVETQYMESSMNATTPMSTPGD